MDQYIQNNRNPDINPATLRYGIPNTLGVTSLRHKIAELNQSAITINTSNR